MLTGWSLPNIFLPSTPPPTSSDQVLFILYEIMPYKNFYKYLWSMMLNIKLVWMRRVGCIWNQTLSQGSHTISSSPSPVSNLSTKPLPYWTLYPYPSEKGGAQSGNNLPSNIKEVIFFLALRKGFVFYSMTSKLDFSSNNTRASD